MTFIIDMVTGKRIASDQPCNTPQVSSSIDGSAANEPWVMPALQPVSSQDVTPEAIPVDITEIVKKFEE